MARESKPWHVRRAGREDGMSILQKNSEKFPWVSLCSAAGVAVQVLALLHTPAALITALGDIPFAGQLELSGPLTNLNTYHYPHSSNPYCRTSGT